VGTVGGVAEAGRIEVPGGDLHQNGGLNGQLLGEIMDGALPSSNAVESPPAANRIPDNPRFAGTRA
jgi:hypothetical protein